jgi:hypothetical protein
MTAPIRLIHRARRQLKERGSALLVSLMVMVGLSLLGLAFVAVSETESAISINQRNHAQVVAISEAGGREVVQFFQNTTQASTLGILPPNDVALKTQRVVDAYTGYYRSTAGSLLCDLPYGPKSDDTFYGDETSADILITRGTTVGRTALDSFNSVLLGASTDPRETGEVTEIRVYAPPIVGGNLVTAASGKKFWVGGTRFGVATIAVKAEKFDKPSTDTTRRSIATATCRIVVSRFPLPTPAGPLQSQTALSTNGNFNVNWGLVSSETSLNLKKDYGTIPWMNAYERIHFERGYDSSVAFVASTTYNVNDVVRPSAATLTANPVLKAHEYMVISATSAAGTEPAASGAGAWPTTSGGTVVSGGVTFKERFPTAYPIDSSSTYSTKPWLYFIADASTSIEDPWFQARCAGPISGDPAGPQPYPFSIASPSLSTPTHHFQNQSFDQYSDYRRIIFPLMDYDYWKATAIAGNGQGSVHYLAYNTATSQWSDGVSSGSFDTWVAKGSGFYFFDSKNNQNPQNGGPGDLSLNISPSGGTDYISGFVYVNATFGTKGLGGITGKFTQPGEPYEDVGYRQVATTTTPTAKVGDFTTDASGQPVITGAYNHKWDYQDLPWSNTGTSGSGATAVNGAFDVHVSQRTNVSKPGGGTYSGYFVDAYYPGCFPGANSCAACNCSEPHEPYLNVLYDGSSTLGLKIGWQAPASETRIPKKTTNGKRTGSAISCTSTSSSDDCTSNGYDLDGGLVTLSPSTDGVLYVEGSFDSTGNADYYGSVLVGQGGVNAKGTPQVWYDEKLQRGDWFPDGMPRVLITSIQTDQN